MAFDDLMLNRVSRRPGMAQPVASGERATIFAADGITDKLDALRKDVDWLLSAFLAVRAETTQSGLVSDKIPTQPTNLSIEGQTIIQDAQGDSYVEVVVTWEGTASEWEIAIARKQ